MEKNMEKEFDIVVIGGGHAGCEAASAAVRMGAKTVLVTMDRGKLALMSCNPAIGGIAKGQIAREVDALGGVMGLVTDRAGIQFRMINTAKGPAVRSARIQCDRLEYSRVMGEVIGNTPGLEIIEGEVTELFIEAGIINGICLADGQKIGARAIILTTGTFLRGLIHCGEKISEGGRDGEPASRGISTSLEKAGIKLGRLKTGTPPRIDSSTVDYSRVEPQSGDEPPLPLSYRSGKIDIEQVPCYLTRTTDETYRIISENKRLSPMFSGQITSMGPQYCPSIEDKVHRFPQRKTHQVFLEPEGRTTNSMYLNGVSTSLPEKIQIEMVNSITGLENAKIIKFGYAIEYDYAFPTQLYPTLESKLVSGLYCAGQINGTSGYEEAAGQGIVAGINAALKIRGEEPFVLQRDEAYIGVLIDDLVTKGTDEPYRMFTSRAEFRLLLRHDNADRRLSVFGGKFGLLPEEYIAKTEKKKALISGLNGNAERIFAEGKSIAQLLRQPGTAMDGILSCSDEFAGYVAEIKNNEPALYAEVIEAVEIEMKYSGYIARAKEEIGKLRRMEKKQIPPDFDYSSISALSKEAQKKLSLIRPLTVGQAARISGVNPADISVLLVALKGRKDMD